LVQAVESMCVHKRASALYEKLCAVCDAHTGARVRAMAEHLGKDDPEFLRHMDVCWRQHCDQMMLIRAVFLYLDRSYVALEGQQLRARSIFDMGLHQFRTHLEGQKQARISSLQYPRTL
jgi:cullin 4